MMQMYVICIDIQYSLFQASTVCTFRLSLDSLVKIKKNYNEYHCSIKLVFPKALTISKILGSFTRNISRSRRLDRINQFGISNLFLTSCVMLNANRLICCFLGVFPF